MSLLLNIRQALSTPPHIVARKLTRKIIRSIRFPRERQRAYGKSSYLPAEALPSSPLLSNLTLPLLEHLLPHAATLHSYCQQYLLHRFDILGSGWVHNKHGVQCKGFGGFCYDAEEFPYAIDESGSWIPFVVNAANAEESLSVWQRIQQPYTAIDWQRDIRSGYSWSEGVWFKEISISSGKGIDPKVPWELGRMHHLLHLALAHQATDSLREKEIYLREFRNQVLDFIALNPPQFGIQWKTTMDVAIRINNMLVARDLLVAQGIEFDADFERIFIRSVQEHAAHIRANLEWSEGMRGNHYLANICGLLIVACYLPPSTEQQAWLDFAVQELQNETLYQFLPDGGNFEASLPYHRLSAEMLVWAIAFALRKPATAQRLGQNTAFAQRLQAIRNFSVAYCYTSGSAPQLGDNDSGRFLPFIPTMLTPLAASSLDGELHPLSDYQNHQHLCACLNALLGISYPEQSQQLEYDLVQSLVGATPLPAPPEKEIPSLFCAQDFGITVYRVGRYQCLLRAGSIGQKGKGGHAHNDQLSLTLAIDGKELFVDCGTYSYTPLPQERNRFRSTSAHNTLVVEGMEQNSWSLGTTDSLFWMNGDRAAARIEHQSQSEWLGIHHGYGSTHQRHLAFSQEEIVITDECHVQGVKSILFHCAPGSQCHQLAARAIQIHLGEILLELSVDTGSIHLEKAAYSRGYGIGEDIHRITIRMDTHRCQTRLRLLATVGQSLHRA